MSEEVPALTGRTRLVVGVGVGVVIAAGLLLRFWTRSGLWLDEALTVDIARLPLHEIPDALKHDGAPPLYYYLLHFWIDIFGQSNDAVRSLSGAIAVITLPVGWFCGRRLGGRAVAWTTLVLLASAPFDVYYATESRMYALVILLTGCGFLALGRAVDKPRPGNLAAVAVVAAALLYTQYWAIYLVAMVGLWLVVSVIRTRRHGHPEAAPWAALIAVAVGCVLFVPWVPTFVYQAKYTGTPWAAPPNFSAVINALTGFTDNQGSTLQTGTNQGRLLAVIYFAMLALALFGIGRSGRIIELDLHTRPRARSLCFVVLGTLFAAIAGGILTASAFSSRYAAVVFLPFILLVALGTTTLLNPKVRVVVVGLAVVAGLVSSAQNVTTQRTQGNAVAAAINAQAKPGDVIAFCPDQLGPSVYRQIRDPSQYAMVTFPRRTGPQIVNWVNYADAVHAADPNAFATDVAGLAGTNHHVWLVWEPMYQTYGVKCETIATDLLEAATKNGGGGRNVVTSHPALYYEPMNLTEYASAGS
jgi:mannosyltransferase